MTGQVEKAVGYEFKDKRLLRQALTLKGADTKFNNESLECLGDAILGFIVAERFYLLGYDEGAITERKKAVAKDEALAEVSKKLGLDKALIRPKGGEGNKKAVPSAYEAMLAAIYCDGGMEQAKKFVYATLDFERRDVDYIAELQEELQGRGLPLPDYGEPTDFGNAQVHEFVVKVSVLGGEYSGKGANSQEAKKHAARSAYIDIKNRLGHK